MMNDKVKALCTCLEERGFNKNPIIEGTSVIAEYMNNKFLITFANCEGDYYRVIDSYTGKVYVHQEMDLSIAMLNEILHAYDNE